ncbi:MULTISPECIES: DUF1801 domain-containing protein [Chryseobacterium]|uniref:Uncharacterized protein YdhG (YjbR/CyaY superfamily) n=1 Tax=Chryseobacterium camelliae TaxID=1265445 RepID=A0ABU0TK35_9FLAO|nr:MULTISPECIES: DUF1801 domain-containing protein [Chryseobacterium]MDT3408742.1 uncharacterized protein YdhG (YjbR/CyaY superfamily) [Pseudacidovorax intermedius]MDQ1097404.1 uncharacterized protein YdhG (YjbR/CyaY superfamily) [Chryseobacterium camelliae]MDQ1101334.1 uncharacterized protein YdhG (YjbR/CyaY superfamily) [Chryseobacterium sp. SORGH_AS_1048]MDR6084779.1 uncharacterized protein YdhG (YjbR/CyaY superfamily) [Chryseobacterium sp. SORGH_AS_0909]MDR6129126.1 uncharacterized protein
MQTTALSAEEYLSQIPEERQDIFKKLFDTIHTHLPEGFKFGMGYGMPGWGVQLELYPAGYHCSPGTPLPFISIASQKNFIALYHMGMYAQPELLEWFTNEYPKYSKRKLDMGKSCVRFKKMDDIPMELIAELCKKVTVQDWIEYYEKNFKKK